MLANIKNNGTNLAYPCGNIAKYKFNDVFEFLQPTANGAKIIFDETNIAHAVDRNIRFKTNKAIE